MAVSSQLFYADAALAAGGVLPLPVAHEDRAAYVLDGEVNVAGDLFAADRMLVFRAGARVARACCCLAARRWTGRDICFGTWSPRH